MFKVRNFNFLANKERYYFLFLNYNKNFDTKHFEYLPNICHNTYANSRKRTTLIKLQKSLSVKTNIDKNTNNEEEIKFEIDIAKSDYYKFTELARVKSTSISQLIKDLVNREYEDYFPKDLA
jgi:hypothetical protein